MSVAFFALGVLWLATVGDSNELPVMRWLGISYLGLGAANLLAAALQRRRIGRYRSDPVLSQMSTNDEATDDRASS